jgi:hypothetical protein
MMTLTDADRDVNGDIPSEADRDWWSTSTREDDWQDDWTWELGPGDDEPTDDEWDAMAEEAAALASIESALRFF